ncbi:antibiotic biosynthesis monooxygenase [Sphaerisporangium rubeum]|uniref:Quinol monooxygenase YgiN n=1 Tax=Sphaerisporangium rubeum TaxID=321317 RepID=A0A7X0IIA8_9ACTN|nr:antibiotic biosynthesis monooxygenase [Sphaerisporangium rubeum]MBB6475754.1 quinol monooxygenase YgiN [Sphaerisporangium rubeum]
MVTVGLLVRIHARPGKEHEIEELLRDEIGLIEDESACAAWFTLRIDSGTFGLFDTFDSDDGRRCYLLGKIQSALLHRADELFTRPPTIEKVDLLAAKLPEPMAR